MNILVADDDLVARKILAGSLAGTGEVETACDGEEAWATISKAYREGRPYGLILLDILMPGLDGQEVLRRTRSLESELGVFGSDRARIAMATHLGDAGNVLGSFRDECDGYIVKPYSRESVMRDLKKYELL
jgi:two-component system chemotaxis response regulator CheY